MLKKIKINYGKFDDTNIPWKDELEKIEKVQILDQVKVNCMKKWFGNCINLKTLINFKDLDVSDCTDFSYVFFNCKSLQNLNGLRIWNVSSGTNFSYMFFNCNFLQDISSLQDWNVSNGIDFSYVFYKCKSFQDLNELQNWNISNGVDFSYMFAFCQSLKKILLPKRIEYLKRDMFYECNTTLKIHWKKHIYTYADLLEYQIIS